MREFWSTLAGGRKTVKPRTGHRSVIDLGTEQTKALVLELRGAEVLVIGVGRSPSPPVAWAKSGSGVDIETVAKSCDRALRQAEDMAAQVRGRPVVPNRVVVGLPNHLTIAQAFTVTHHRSNAASRINEQEFGEVVERAERLGLQQLARRAEPLDTTQGMKLELLESAVAEVQIDGHGVTHPIGLRGEALTVAVFNVVAQSGHLRTVEAVSEDLGLETLTIMSSWQAMASLLRERDGVCIDIGGKATDVVLARGGRPSTTDSLPLGGAAFTQHLADALGLSWRNAESWKLAFSRGRMKQPSRGHVSEAMGKVIEMWLEQLEGGVKKLAGSDPVPHEMRLCGGGSGLPGLAEALRSHPWTHRLNFARHPEVRLMDSREVPGILDRTGELRGQQDVVPLALASRTAVGGSKLDSPDRQSWQVKRPSMFGGRGGKP